MTEKKRTRKINKDNSLGILMVLIGLFTLYFSLAYIKEIILMILGSVFGGVLIWLALKKN